MGLRTRLSSWLAPQGSLDAAASVRRQSRPGASGAAEVELVNGEVYADDMIEVAASSSAMHFERYRSLIDFLMKIVRAGLKSWCVGSSS